MRSIVLILLILNSYAYGQRKSRTINNTEETIKKGDSLEILYANESLFKIATDTLPQYISDENSNWRDWMRDLQVVNYFYDNSNVLKKISFKNGRKGTYYFYFEETYLRKVRILTYGNLINLQYYYTDYDNTYIISVIDPIPTKDPGRQEFYEILKTGKAFFDKFKTMF